MKAISSLVNVDSIDNDKNLEGGFSAESSVMSDPDHVPFYSKVRRRVPIDPTKHYFDSKFEIKTTVHKQAEWKEKLTATR